MQGVNKGQMPGLRSTHLSIQRVHYLAYFFECVDRSTVRVLRGLEQVNRIGPVRQHTLVSASSNTSKHPRP